MDKLILGQETPDNKAPLAEPKPRKGINLALMEKSLRHGD